jgi:hypothetical protein
MKKIILLAGLIIPMMVMAQFEINVPVAIKKNDSTYYSNQLGAAGQRMIDFADQSQIGAGLTFGGALLAISAPIFVKYEGTDQAKIEQKERYQQNFVIAGSVFIISGAILQFISYNQARIAGKIIKENSPAYLGPTRDGIGIVVPIK